MKSWIKVWALEAICLVRGHLFGFHLTDMGLARPGEETSWCSRCGREQVTR